MSSRPIQLHYCHLTLNNPGFWTGQTDEGLIRARRCASLHLRLMHGLSTDVDAGTSPPDETGLGRIRTTAAPAFRELYRKAGSLLTATGARE